MPIRAVADLGAGALEVIGRLVIPSAAGLIEEIESMRPTLEVEEAALRRHGPAGADVWEEVESLSLAAVAVQVIVPGIDDEIPPVPDGEREARVKMMTASLEVTGFLRLATKRTVDGYLESSRSRFVPLLRARIRPAGMMEMPEIEGLHQLVMVNTERIAAAIEARPTVPVGPVSEVLSR